MKYFVCKLILKLLKTKRKKVIKLYDNPEEIMYIDYYFPHLAIKILRKLDKNNNNTEYQEHKFISIYDRINPIELLKLRKIKKIKQLEITQIPSKIDIDPEPKKRLYKLENDQKIVLNF